MKFFPEHPTTRRNHGDQGSCWAVGARVSVFWGTDGARRRIAVRQPRSPTRSTSRSMAAYRVIVSNGIARPCRRPVPEQRQPECHLGAEALSFRVPATPQTDRRADRRVARQIRRIAVNGVPFDPGAAEYWNRNPQVRAGSTRRMGGGINLGVDSQNAHVQPTGAYHYHGIPAALAARVHGGGHGQLIGWAADGFPIYIRTGYGDPSVAGGSGGAVCGRAGGSGADSAPAVPAAPMTARSCRTTSMCRAWATSTSATAVSRRRRNTRAASITMC